MWIMIAGPYRGGSSNPAEWAQNLGNLNKAAHTIFEKGHVPVIGVNMALPVIAAVLRIGGLLKEPIRRLKLL